MPKAGDILANIAEIAKAFNNIVEIVRNIRSAREALRQVCECDIPGIWPGATNADSNMFCQRMEELRVDIDKMIATLDEYTELLERTAKDYENTQRDVHSRANSLRSPSN